MEMKNPPHPGTFVRMEIIEARGLTVTSASEVLGVTRAALSAFLNGRAGLSGEMAIRFEKAFGYPMDLLMRMQNYYETQQARQRASEIMVNGFVPADAAGESSA